MVINLNNSHNDYEKYAQNCRRLYRALRYGPVGVQLLFTNGGGVRSALGLTLIPTGGIAEIEDALPEGPVDALLIIAPAYHTAICTDIEEVNGVFKMPEEFRVPADWRARVAYFLVDVVHCAEEGTSGDSKRG